MKQAKRKPGRPPGRSPDKEARVSVRVTREEMHLLEQCCILDGERRVPDLAAKWLAASVRNGVAVPSIDPGRLVPFEVPISAETMRGLRAGAISTHRSLSGYCRELLAVRLRGRC